MIPAYIIETKNYIIEIKKDQYLQKYFEKNEYEIGHVTDKNYNELLKIIYVKDCYNIFNGHSRMVANNGFPFIAISKFFYDNWFVNSNNKVLAVVIMHEFGHFVNGDLGEKSANSNDEERVKYLINNKVEPRELAADKFAVNEMGKSAFNNFIDKVISIRKQRKDKGMELAIKEFELRKKFVVKIK